MVLGQVLFDTNARLERLQENIRLAETLTAGLALLFYTLCDNEVDADLSVYMINNLWMYNRRGHFPHLVNFTSQN